MMKRFLFLICLLVNGAFCLAQEYNTCIQGDFAVFHVPKAGLYFTPEQIGIEIIRKMNQKISFSIGFQDWFLGYDGGVDLNLKQADLDKIGTITMKNSYKFIDATVRYSVLSDAHNDVFGGIGCSFANGVEEYIFALPNIPGYPNDLLGLKKRHVSHIGGNIVLGYNRMMLKERFSIGMSGHYRILSKDFNGYDICFNIAYHLNTFKRKKVQD
jgi:hypothetical protein